jgi:hypothetical protein
MNIIQKKWEFLNATSVLVPAQAKKLYRFGLETLAVRDIGSLRASARITGLNWNTAKSKNYRLTKNRKMVPVFSSMLTKTHDMKASDHVAVDFSDFGGGMQVLMFAKQTNRGRAIPLYFEVLQYPVSEKSQNTFVINAVKHFGAIVGCRPMLIFDRGFACPSIVSYLLENQWKFIIRMKQMKFAADPETGCPFPLGKAAANDQPVVMYENIIRLVVSDKAEGSPQPWYLATSDTNLSRNEIIEIYYHRFEIEEFFRDAKRLLGLEPITFKNIRSLSVVLWFVVLGTWCLRHLETLLDELKLEEREKMRLSAVRYLFEKIKTIQVLAAEREYVIGMPSPGS